MDDIRNWALFRDRAEAGQVLALRLRRYAKRTDVVVLGLPRGGVPVAAEVASELAAPLDVLLVRKLGVPGHDEYAFGAIAGDGVLERNELVIRQLRISDEIVRTVAARETNELTRRERAYRHGRPALDVAGKITILVDDGLATGSTMRAAITALRRRKPARIVVAAPVGAKEVCQELRQLADECVCGAQPEPFTAVGVWYEDFAPTNDSEVIACLERIANERGDGARRASSANRKAS